MFNKFLRPDGHGNFVLNDNGRPPPTRKSFEEGIKRGAQKVEEDRARLAEYRKSIGSSRTGDDLDEGEWELLYPGTPYLAEAFRKE